MVKESPVANTQWSSLASFIGKDTVGNWPADDSTRLAAYDIYDNIYWNDPSQYAIRVLEGEQPLYIPNGRVIVNTTAYYLAKGLQITLGEGHTPDQAKFLSDFLKRETFYSQFNLLKHTTVARGDGVLHWIADDDKEEGTKISLEVLHPGTVYRYYDDEDPSKIVQVDIVSIWTDPDLLEQYENAAGYGLNISSADRIRVLRYFKTDEGVDREEVGYELNDRWWEIDTEPYREILARETLPEPIDQIPVYWFKNIDWDGQEYGSSELRGLESLKWAVSQGATDTQASLGLEGLGVYATDGGRPVDESGNEEDWEVAPGKVMEVPQGSYFRRVEGVGSITPMMDQIEYLEHKVKEASGITGVSTGDVDVAVAQSGIALAIKFIPTLAKLEFRDQHFVDRLAQMFYDLKKWFRAYEDLDIEVDIEINIDEDKLPVDRKERLNELNNMMDRKIISKRYYRREVAKLGYTFPTDNVIEDEMMEELKMEIELEAYRASLTGSPAGSQEDDQEDEELPPESNPDNGKPETKKENGSNNQSRVNESNGTEA